MKYKCEECLEEFDEPATCHDDMTEYWGVSGAGTYKGCPYCESAFYKDLDEEEEEN